MNPNREADTWFQLRANQKSGLFVPVLVTWFWGWRFFHDQISTSVISHFTWSCHLYFLLLLFLLYSFFLSGFPQVYYSHFQSTGRLTLLVSLIISTSNIFYFFSFFLILFLQYTHTQTKLNQSNPQWQASVTQLHIQCSFILTLVIAVASFFRTIHPNFLFLLLILQTNQFFVTFLLTYTQTEVWSSL